MEKGRKGRKGRSSNNPTVIARGSLADAVMFVWLSMFHTLLWPDLWPSISFAIVHLIDRNHFLTVFFCCVLICLIPNIWFQSLGYGPNVNILIKCSFFKLALSLDPVEERLATDNNSSLSTGKRTACDRHQTPFVEERLATDISSSPSTGKRTVCNRDHAVFTTSTVPPLHLFLHFSKVLYPYSYTHCR